jgi:predicted nucleic acid-binding protein
MNELIIQKNYLKLKMNKTIVFDTGPIITLTLNNLLWILKPLKEKFNGNFVICPAVFHELIQKPLMTKKYKFEALQILPYIMDKTIILKEDKEIIKNAHDLIKLANNCFIAKQNPINIFHEGEMQAIATALLTNAKTIAIDERSTRLLIENPFLLQEHLQKKLHTNIQINHHNIHKIKKIIGDIKVIRSFELGFIAYKLDLLNKYLIKEEEKLKEIDDIRESVLEGMLWAIKLAGCSVKTEDIYKIIDFEINNKKL